MPIYLVHPPDSRFHGLSGWIQQIKVDMSSDPEWEGFSLRCMELRANAGFQVTDLTSRVIAEPGPVLFFRQTQSHPRELAQEKLEDCTVTSITNPASKTDLLADLKALRDRFVGGGAERFLPRRLVAIILIVRKLYNGKYWGGNHNKGFLKSDDIANGRGVSPDFKDIAATVANFLRITGILVAKKGGRRRGRRKEQKYALNTERRSDIESLVDGEYDESIRHWAFKDSEMIAARDLEGWRRLP